MNVLVIDIGGTHVKILATGQNTPRAVPSEPTLTATRMVSAVKKPVGDWRYDVVSLGYPGLVVHGRPVLEPRNLRSGGVGFDFTAAFGCPVKVINDAAMQALDSYQHGTMVFLGLGNGLGSAMIVDAWSCRWNLPTCPSRKATYEDYVGVRGLSVAAPGSRRLSRLPGEKLVHFRLRVVPRGHREVVVRDVEGEVRARDAEADHPELGGGEYWEDGWHAYLSTFYSAAGWRTHRRPVRSVPPRVMHGTPA